MTTSEHHHHHHHTYHLLRHYIQYAWSQVEIRTYSSFLAAGDGAVAKRGVRRDGFVGQQEVHPLGLDALDAFVSEAEDELGHVGMLAVAKASRI